MASRRKKIANRANGAKSQGPKTPEGLQKPSMNALRYGLYAKRVVLSNESEENYKGLCQTFVDKFQPTDEVEHGLLEEMVAAQWRRQRVWMIETATLDFAMDAKEAEYAKIFKHIDQPTRLALAYKDAMPQLASIQRCEASYRRQYDRALKNLLLLRETTTEPGVEGDENPLRNEPNMAPEPLPDAIPDAQQNEPKTPPQLITAAQTELDSELDAASIANLTPRLRKLLHVDENQAA